MNFKFLTAIALAMPIFAFSANSAATTVKFDAPPSKLNKDVMFAFQNRKSAEKFTEKVCHAKGNREHPLGGKWRQSPRKCAPHGSVCVEPTGCFFVCI